MAYIAKLSLGRPCLSEVTIVKQSDKSLWLQKVRDVMGYIWVGNRTGKDGVNIFPTLRDALKYLAAQEQQYVEHLEKQLRAAREYHDAIKGILGVMEQQDQAKAALAAGPAAQVDEGLRAPLAR